MINLGMGRLSCEKIRLVIGGVFNSCKVDRGCGN